MYPFTPRSSSRRLRRWPAVSTRSTMGRPGCSRTVSSTARAMRWASSTPIGALLRAPITVTSVAPHRAGPVKNSPSNTTAWPCGNKRGSRVSASISGSLSVGRGQEVGRLKQGQGGRVFDPEAAPDVSCIRAVAEACDPVSKLSVLRLQSLKAQVGFDVHQPKRRLAKGFDAVGHERRGLPEQIAVLSAHRAPDQSPVGGIELLDPAR